MRADEILIVAVLIMLIASIFMGLTVQLSLRHSRKAFEALIKEIGAMRLATLNLDDEVAALKRDVEMLYSRIAELERT